MEGILERLVPPPCKIGWIGHSQVDWADLDPRWQPYPDAEIKLYKHPGAKAELFQTYDTFRAALNDHLDLAILWIGGNDINPSVHPGQVAEWILEAKRALENRGTHTIVMTVEGRRYRPGQRHYVPLVDYNRHKNLINRILQRRLRGRIILTGGLTLNYSHLNMDGVHINRTGRENIQRKVLGAIDRYLVTWRRRERRNRNIYRGILGYDQQ